MMQGTQSQRSVTTWRDGVRRKVGACPQANSRGRSLIPAQSLQRPPCGEVFLKPRTVYNLQSTASPSLG